MRCFITNRDCKYKRPVEDVNVPGIALEQLTPGSIFMISPFGFPFDDLFLQGVSKTINRPNADIVTRADQALQLGYVMCQRVCKKILDAKWVLADLTMPNGNVYYELGLAYGLSRNIVLLSNQWSTNPYRDSLVEHGIPMLTYSKLADLQKRDEYEKYLKLAYRVSEEDKEKLAPHALLEKPPMVLNILSEDCPSLDLHYSAIRRAIDQYNMEVKPPRSKLEPWQIETLQVRKDTNISDAVRSIEQAKICLFDTTHYEDQPNAIIFFLLGVAHASEREVIPLVNQPLNHNIPFDIRGLWQVNFQTAEQLKDELVQILPTIDDDFKRDKVDYPYHRIWDPFRQHEEIQVLTCAREMKEDADRDARTDIDLWDFESVSQLSLFIAQMYESVKVKIKKPKNKPRCDELENHKKKDNMVAFHHGLRAELEHKDTIIIGSPDVSDYAEVVLADLYDIPPHVPQEKGSRLPFRFVKKTIAEDHPRHMSAFYRLPDKDETQKVEFGQPVRKVECGERLETRRGESIFSGKTYVVITIARQKITHGNQKDEYHTMVISGFTGIATYAAVRLLTDPECKAELEKYLAERVEKLNKRAPESTIGVNILVSIEYTRPNLDDPKKFPGDRRVQGRISFEDIELIPRPSSWPSCCHAEHV
jgi:hypothetical protein